MYMAKVINYLSDKKSIILLLLVFGAPFLSVAETGGQQSLQTNFLNVFVLVLLAFIVFVLAFILYALKVFRDYIYPDAKAASSWSWIKSLTDSVPVEKEEEILTVHVYDGIRELDNNLPPWWKYMFYATIVFSCVYLYYYHIGNSGKLQMQEYQEEMTLGEKQKEEYLKKTASSIDENNVKLLADAATLEKGKTIFTQNCAACHGRAGEGGVGPNLTDEYWLHGGGVKNIFKTIKYGVPDKGMISWKSQLSPTNIQEVASYIVSLKGSNPPNAKAAQGDKYDESNQEIASK